MKHFIKHITTLLISILFFIIGDMAVKGAWINKIDNSEYIISHKLGADKAIKTEIILVKIIADNGLIVDNKIFDGLQIQLMNAEYQELLLGVIRNGTVQFDLGGISKRNKSFVLISPITGNELSIEKNTRNFEMKLDASELIIKQKANKKMK